ncbi:hypothetical protein Dip518_001349 [Parelusimicrobium proximum]|uniref:hypothetical protein n=1 Tax=Parelusimicrobium proximum TaxID=3228953 RepID=UPI003D1700BD
MTDLEVFFDKAPEKLDTMISALKKHEITLRDLAFKAGDLIKEVKKGRPAETAEFSDKFNELAAALQKDTDAQYEFWKEARDEIFGARRRELENMNSLIIRSFNIKARQVSSSIDALESSVVFFRSEIKGLNVSLNMWILDYCLTTLTNLVNRILFIARDLNKSLEMKNKR